MKSLDQSDMSKCSTCELFKLHSEFYKCNKWTCIECLKKVSILWYANGGQARQKKLKKDRTERRFIEWKEIIVEIYSGLTCQCCGKQLFWYEIGNGKNPFVVSFDHRYKDEIISDPYSWFVAHDPTDQNIAVFESCDFGLVCGPCNFSLGSPINRKSRYKMEWEYINRGPI